MPSSHVSSGRSESWLPLLRDLAGWFVPYRRQVVAYVGVVVMAGVATIAGPLLLRELIDRLMVPAERGALVLVIVGFVVVGLARTSGQSAAHSLGSRLGMSVSHDLRLAVYERVQAQPLVFHRVSQAGALQDRIVSEPIRAQAGFTGVLQNVITNGVLLVAALGATVALSPVAALAMVAVAGILLFPARRANRELMRAGRSHLAASSEVQSWVAETVGASAVTTTALFGVYRANAARLAERSLRWRDAVIDRNVVWARLQLALGSLGAVGLGAVYAVGAALIVGGRMSVGTLVALGVLVQRTYDPLATLATQGAGASGGLLSFARLQEILRLPAQDTACEALPSPVGVVEFDEVWFRYPDAGAATLSSLRDPEGAGRTGGGDWALRGVSFTVRPGSTVALVGSTGAGKTTAAFLAAGLLAPSSGRVTIDGVDASAIRPADRRRAVLVVTQDIHVFNDTLRANLALAAPEVGDEVLLSACRSAELGPLLDRLPDGLDTVVGDQGMTLSGGERQRLAIARAFLRRPAALVLDEPAAHLDMLTERAIHTGINRELAGTARVIIAHRLQTVVDADVILVLEGGRLLEQGTHAELVAHGGIYQSLLSGMRSGDTPGGIR